MLDAAAMGEVLETFIVSSTPIDCITGIPAFDDNDPDVLTSEFSTSVTLISTAVHFICDISQSVISRFVSGSHLKARALHGIHVDARMRNLHL